ncbi:hypothetical protein EXIGLDRAFT_844757 [Exidia glandulosa HHB12029]|uniref:F-box domain-containing protein n=1 Tax=Exidia glandulosa HHB12029 TaxID=1314781 RepID=A0A165BUE6_EXIGL|nr:hypothetical protein EXIGLDRAFT_844757 [Exidia glandulosa HHB12029]
MLTPNHNLALEACLRDVFRDLTHGAHSASHVQEILMAVMDKSLRVLRDEMFEWNASFITQRLPPEVLAICMQCLPFMDRIRVSHVSRDWRSVALAFPALWADIRLSTKYRAAPHLLRLALSRTGICPIDFTYSQVTPTIDNFGINDVLCEHMHHLRSIDWSGSIDMTCFSRPAPMLEVIRCTTVQGPSVHGDFLGGVVGRLRSMDVRCLYLADEPCPALSTVQHLECSLPWNVTVGENGLFSRAPALEFLALRNVRELNSLPSGPAPPSLKHVSIETTNDDFDFDAVLEEWGHDQMNYISLRSGITDLNYFPSIIRNLVSLDVSVDLLQPPYSIVFRGHNHAGFTRLVAIPVEATYRTQLHAFTMLALYIPRVTLWSCTSLQSLGLPLPAWISLLEHSIALTCLAHLTIRVSEDDEYCSLCVGDASISLILPALRDIVVEVPLAAMHEIGATPTLTASHIIGQDALCDAMGRERYVNVTVIYV